MKRLVKNISYFVNICLLLMLLSGCEYKPDIVIRESYWSFENKTFEIENGTEYYLNQGHSYDIEYTDDGMDITFHFKRK